MPSIASTDFLSGSLQDFENHRTSTEYEDSLVIKLFCFTFCNSYGGFIYLAFVGEPVVGVACEKSCMSLLATNLTIVFIVQLLVGDHDTRTPPRAHTGTNDLVLTIIVVLQQ